MDYLLYRFECSEGEADAVPTIAGRVVEFSLFSPSWLPRACRAGGLDYLKAIALATWAVLAGAAKSDDFRVFAYVSGSGKILHYSVVSPTSVHMPWLPKCKHGREVGGCLTVAAARGNRIYPYVLRCIAQSSGPSVPLYMIVGVGNASSRAGMEKAGFVLANSLSRKFGVARPPRYEIRATGSVR